MTIKKRDGSIEEFDFNKVKRAIEKAFMSVGQTPDDAFLDDLNFLKDKMKSEQDLSVESIQNSVELFLMQSGYYNVAKSYIIYREKHKNIRDWANQKIKFIEKYKQSDNTANATIDDNSNVSNRNIAVLNAEIHKSDNQIVNYKILENKLKELYPEFDYKKMMIDFNSICYLHDSSSQIGMPYCVAISLYPFLLHGLEQIGGLSAAPKNIDSFCGMFVNLVFAIAGQYKGAVAVPGIWLAVDSFLRKEWGDNYYQKPDAIISSDHCLRKNTIKHQIHQYFQQICYTLMQPSGGRNAQAVFWNCSIFDKPFFDTMYSDFVFPDGTKPQWESLNWLQKEFLHWLNQERLKCILTFPVVSVCLLYKNGEFLDKELAEFVAKEYSEGNSFFTYISDSADSLSSCCFKGDEVIKVYDQEGNIFSTTLEDFVNYNNSDICKDGNICLKSDFYVDSYNLSGEKERVKITGTLKKEYTGAMYTFNTDEDSITITADHELMVKNNKGEIISVKAEDVAKSIEDYELVVVEKNFKKIISVQTDHVEKQVVYDIELQKNHYFAANNIVSHNCRLSSKIERPQFNFTNGQLSEMTGSKNVITLNLSRIIQDWARGVDGENTKEKLFNNQESLKDYIISILDRVYKYQTAYNECLTDLLNARMLSVYDAGFINMKKQYLTIGINALNQAWEFFGGKCNKNEDYKKFCNFIFTTIKEQNAAHKTPNLMFNTEFTPCESASIKLYNRDKKDGYWTPTDTNLYASYIFKPNDAEISVLDKIYLHGRDFCGDNLDGR